MNNLYKFFLLVIIAELLASPSYAQNSAVFTDSRNGTLGDVPFKIKFTDKANSTYISKIDVANFSSYYFRTARLSASQPVFSYPYEVVSNLSITFDKPIEHLKLYLNSIRAVDIQFNKPFKLLEGAYNVTAVESVNQIKVTKSPGYVIIEFTEPVSTLTFTPLSVPESGYQALTFTDGDSLLLGVNEMFAKSNNLNLYPSLSSDFIQILGLKETENYNIYNVLGAKVGSGEIFEDKKIAVSNLVYGIYFLKLDSGNTFKFIKK